MNLFDINHAVQGKGGTVYSCQPEHVEFMLSYQRAHACLAGSCQSACEAGLKYFPALKLVRGLINLTGTELNLTDVEEHDVIDFFVNGHGNFLPHWWLETDEGYIVDASWQQFTEH